MFSYNLLMLSKNRAIQRHVFVVIQYSHFMCEVFGVEINFLSSFILGGGEGGLFQRI
jgi:hypothetical protein